MKAAKLGILFVLGLTVLFYGCKKEEVEPQAFMQNYIVGAWRIRYNIQSKFTNNIITKRDTLTTYNPIDTLVFTTDGQAIRRNKVVLSSSNYSISADGETITFTNPNSTQKFTFVHLNEIGLGSETFANTAGNEVKTQIADHLTRVVVKVQE